MAMTQDQSGALMQDTRFRNRVQVCCVKYADSIITANSNAMGHNGMENWAKSVFQSPVQVATQIQPAVVNDSAVQAAGVDGNGVALIGDVELQGSVEATVNKSF